MPPTHCPGTGADAFIAKWFHDCVFSARDYAGFVLGLASIAVWCCAQFPQIWRNFRNKSAEALSAWFLAEWLMGDTCNLIGCLLTGSQLVTQTYTAMYFICADIVLVMQFIYYGTLRRRRLRAVRAARARRRALEEASLDGELTSRVPLVSQLGQTPKPRALACVGLLVLSGHLMLAQQPGAGALPGRQRRRLLGGVEGLLGGHRGQDWARDVGQAIGWVSSGFYLGSRAAQIYKTWARQSAEGLSLAMFACAVTANLLYGCGILLRSYAWADVLASAPWLLGSLGTVALDLVIFGQFSWYEAKGPEGDPLLEEGGSD